MLCIANKIYDAFRKRPVNCHAGNISLTYWTVFYGKLRKLYGNLIGNSSESAGLVSGNIVIPITEISSIAQFKITPKQFELFKKGISKIRLSTTPIEHERTFSKDKIGKELYLFFLKHRDKENDF